MARLTSLGLTNFKSIGGSQQKIALSPITLLFGPNSAGKSTVLQALIYLKEIVSKRNLNPDKTELGGNWLDLGGFQNLIHGRSLNTAIEFEVDIALDGDELPDYLSDYEQSMLDEARFPAVADFFSELKVATLRFELRWSGSLSKVVIDRYECLMNEKEVVSIQASSDARQINIEAMPLLFEGLRAPIESFGDNASLVQLLNDLLNTSVMERGSTELSVKRPFKDDSIAEIEKRVLTQDLPAKPLLNQVRAELTHRSSRSAHALDIEVDKLLAMHDAAPVFEFVGLHNQSDAMPNMVSGLEFDADIWREIEGELEDLGNEEKLKHLAMAVINTAICGPLQVLSKWLDDLSYIGPLRDLPPRNILPRSTPDKSRWATGIAAWEMLPTAKSSDIDEINFWLGDGCLDSGYQLLVKKYRELEDSHPLYRMLDNELDEDDQDVIKDLLKEIPHKVRVCLKEKSSDLEVMPQDIGVGISQLFPVIALSVIQKGGLAAIEQPELHIHPRLQVELADVFVRYAKNHNVMFLLETHSEHLMLRLLRRVREAAGSQSPAESVSLSPKDLAVHYVEPADLGTEFKRLRVSEDGDFLDEWPAGFFDERDEELFF
jgi:hypothetical protein